MNEQNTSPAKRYAPPWTLELCGIFVLALLLVYFLDVSWRKWPDPIVDTGPQWYAAWRISQGEMLYHNLAWNYGPLSAYFNGFVFKIFGVGIMTLATVNLLIYGLILTLAYWAFRIAWGWLAAFTATAVFISVFSFSHLCAIGNYNYALPYSHESTHGMLIVTAALVIAFQLSRRESLTMAFLLGLCGGLATVLKPEFMLAGGVLGVAAILLRRLQKKLVRTAEFFLVLAGVVLPTLLFAAAFSRSESWRNAIIDASNAWWLVLAHPIDVAGFQHGQAVLSGLDEPARNTLIELRATLGGIVVMAAIWAAGWVMNSSKPVAIRAALAALAAVLICFSSIEGGWYEIGRCFPAIIAILLVIVVLRIARSWREYKTPGDAAIMSLMLILLAGTMLARMPLRSRVYHFGFFQAAYAGMVIAAAMVAELPKWTGPGRWGSRIALFGSLAVLAVGCGSIAAMSNAIRREQTQPVGTGRDRFYAFNRQVDPIGTLVDWVSQKMLNAPEQTTLLVLPDGLSINYLSRHVSPAPELSRGSEIEVLDHLRRAPPDYVVLISRSLAEYGVRQYGASNGSGYEIVKWVNTNYTRDAWWGGDPLAASSLKGAAILHYNKPDLR